MSKVSALYHIVFCTKYREMTLTDSYLEDVYRFIWSEVKKQKCILLRIGGIANHVHMLVELNPTTALAAFMRAIKSDSSGWLRRDARFPLFCGWAGEYFACTISPRQKQVVIEYINGQQQHHYGRPVEMELSEMYRIAGLEYDERDMKE